MQGAPAAVAAHDEDQQQPLSRIQIVVRARPVLPHEASQQVAVTCSNDGSSVQVVLPEREFSKPAIAASSKPDARAYDFDACLTGSTTQAELFDVCGIADLVEAAVDGYNVTVFAFGQTGSGKTYTIIGPSMAGMQGFNDGRETAATATASRGSSSPASTGRLAAATPEPPTPSSSDGLVATGAAGDANLAEQLLQTQEQVLANVVGQQPALLDVASLQQQTLQLQQLSEHEGLLARCVHQLFAAISDRQGVVECSVAISCTEVYNETVTDLLARNKTQQLQVRQDPRTEAFYVEGLTHAPAQTPSRALRVLSEALAWRHTRAHKLNSYSSRSHCLITLDVVSQTLDSPGQQLMYGGRGSARRHGKLVLVDLAGSERLNSTGNSGARESLKETGAINRSLFTLGQVLVALSVRGGCGTNSHVPYRDSRLTQLLWEGLRGGGRVLMLACLCPLMAAAEESLNTLHFASMALRIKSTPVIMMDPQDQQLSEMRTMIKVLQDDCRSLASALTQMSAGADVSVVLQTLPPTLVQDALRYGSSSAPALDQPHQRSPVKGQRGSRAGLRASGSLGKPKAIYMSKPATADPRMQHSMPALPYHTNSSTPSSCKSPGSRQQRKVGRQSTQQQLWEGRSSPQAAGSDLLPPLSLQGSGRNSPSPSWPSYATPPRSINSMPLTAAMSRAGRAGSKAAGPAQLSGAGSISLGPATTAKLFPGSRRQGMYHAGASGLYGVLSGPLQGSGCCKPSWVSTTRTDIAAANMSQLVDKPAGMGQLPAAGVHGAGCAGDGSSSSLAGLGGLWGCAFSSAVSSKQPAAPEAPMLESFPELAALEQQFQMLQQSPPQRQTPQPHLQQPPASTKAFDVQLLGSSGVLLPSGLPASISDPHSLVPVRIGVADADCLGTSPDASPAAVALAAADSQVRPIAMVLPAELTRAAAAAGTGAPPFMDAAAAASGSTGVGEAASSGVGAQPDPQALSWAQRNVWFGADADMTRLAYKVHDVLVGEQGVDPSSPLYYTAIESHVAAAFPDKLAHWQQLVGTTGGAAGAKRRSGCSTGYTNTAMQPSSVSYKVHLKGPVPKFSGSPCSSPPRLSQPQQQPQQQQPGCSLTLSQVLQHPVLGSALSPHQVQQQQQQLLDKHLPQQLLRHYQQAHPQLLQQPQQSQLFEQGAQQQQHGLPELRQSESPQPAGRVQQSSPVSGSAAADYAAGQGIPAAGDSLGLSSASILGTNSHNRSPGRHHLEQQQQQPWPEGALTGSRWNVGGISAAASKVLQTSTPSLYDGSGPLSSGVKPAWSSSNQGRGVQAGADLAHVLRSGLNPGNKSLAELQVEYKAARALVLDRLRQQKEAAEVQRKQILLQLGRAISNSAWRA